ncbi:hypothetical protein BKK79_26935 [Cupriavidus sp. USMAA2-4]|uniref:helix-turn-helix transcriptional regulator n=1 Tax=Cupriavidus sp. USMAA2-4 TaxID=876364 RepID=UPI0008A6CA41|nr:AraC family transcriptional regulator [Cupriavidus sp. USMAA2-4]AOY95405.1 hypothetical protein BKK79_26935 [Cupriavidus sp. USMAA2-4]
MEANRTALEIIARETGRGPERLLASHSGTIFGARWNHPPCEARLYGNADHVLVYHLSGNTDVERRRHGLVTGFRSRIGALTFMPRASDTEWRVGGHTQVLHLYLPHSVFEEFSRDTLEQDACPEIDAFFAVTDPWLDGFFRMLASESPTNATDGMRTESLVLDQIQVLLVRHLVQRYSLDGPDAGRHRGAHGGTLRQSVMRKLAEVFAERLHEDIRLQDLAQVACMSKDHFLRIFHASFGQTPHRYMTALRFERARTLLRDEPDTPVLDIARRCGFKNLSHFSAAFRRHVGMSPSRFRDLR